MIRCIILDFDGTFTDVEAEAVPFLERYKLGLGRELGTTLDSLWDEAVKAVKSEPDAHGFEFEGRIVAPSHADPYILATSVARLVLSDPAVGENVDREAALETLFRESYASCATLFRPNAKETIEAVLARDVPTFVVTNSDTEQVKTKIAALGLRSELPVFGNARKFHLVEPEPSDDRFRQVEGSVRLGGLDRPVYLRRGCYYEVLREIWLKTGASPEATMVCGDIYELDLALPARLGAQTHLIARASTPDYELAAAEAAGGWSRDLEGFLERLTISL